MTETIWQTGICIEDGKLVFFDVHSTELPVEIVSRYKWDRVVRMDVPEQKRTMFMAKDRITLDAFWNGWSAFKEFALPSPADVEVSYELQHKHFLKKMEEECQEKN